MRSFFKDRPWNAIVLAPCGIALLIHATIGLKDVPIPSRYAHSRMSRLWEKHPSAVIAGLCGWVCVGLAGWLSRSQQELDDTNDPADHPIAHFDQSDPVLRPPEAR